MIMSFKLQMSKHYTRSHSIQAAVSQLASRPRADHPTNPTPSETARDPSTRFPNVSVMTSVSRKPNVVLCALALVVAGQCCASAAVGRGKSTRLGRGDDIGATSLVSVASGDGLEFTFGTKVDPSSPTINSVRVGEADIGVEQPRFTGFEVRNAPALAACLH